MEQAIVPDNALTLATESVSWEMKAAEVNVTDQVTLDEAGTLLTGIKKLRKAITDSFGPLKQKAHQTHSAICEEERKHDAPLKAAEKIIKESIGSYMEEQRRIAARVAAKQEQERREREAAAAAEAAELEAAGETELAEAVTEEAEAVQAAPPPEKVRTAGVSMRDNWVAEVVDPMLLVTAVAAGDVPIAVIKFDTKVLGQQAKSLRKALNWPGVKVTNKPVVAGRA